MDGSHSIERCEEVTVAVLHAVFSALRDQRVWLGRILLKPNMVVAGKDWPYPASVQEVATATLRCLRCDVPAAVPGIVFLSGGQDDRDWLIFRHGCPGGEMPEQVGARVDRVVARVRAVEGNVALFAHGHVLRVLVAPWIGLPPGAGQHFLLDTGTLSVLSYYYELPAVRAWNGPLPTTG